MPIAAAYARVSSDRQKEEQTIGSQVTALKEQAVNAGYQLPEEWMFQDEGYSGAVLTRPALEQLRDLVAEGQVDVVLVYAPDRLSRKYAYQVLLVEEFARHGVEVVFLRAPAGDTPEEQLVVQFQGMIAEYERAMIVERTRRGKRHRARQGSVNVLGGAPYGYRYVRKTDMTAAYYEVEPERATVVQEIFRLYTSEGYTIGGLTRWLNDRQIPTTTGTARWERSTVWGMLKNPAYCGRACFGKTEAKPRERITRRIRQKGTHAVPSYAYRDTPRSGWIEIPVPPLVQQDVFDWAQERLAENRERSARNTKTPGLLQGLLVCGECGYAYYRTSTRTSRRQIRYYRCLGSDRYRWPEGRRCSSRPLREDYLEKLIWDSVIELLQDPELIQQEIERRREMGRRINPAHQRGDAVASELLRVQRSMDKLLDAYQAELMTLDDLRPRITKLRQRQNALTAEQQALAVQQVDDEALLQIAHNVDGFLEHLQTSADTLDTLQRRKILRLVIKEVVIDRQTIRIRHSIPCARAGPLQSPASAHVSAGYLLCTGCHQSALGQSLLAFCVRPVDEGVPSFHPLRALCRRYRCALSIS